MVKNRKLSTLTIAATYIGTVVGAGFATGQEVFQFFTLFGRWGIFGLIMASFLFIYFGFLIMDIGRELQAKSHLKVIKYAGGKWVGSIIDWVITFFLFGALVIMAAGAGAIFKEQFGLSTLLGSSVMIILSLGTVLLGLRNIIKAISFVVPFLLLAVLSVAIYSVLTNPITPEKIAFVTRSPKVAAPNWFIATMLYVSYNIVLSVAVLAPLGVITEKRETLKKGAILGGLGLGLGALAINLGMLANIPQTARFEVPMVFLANRIAPLIALLYSIVLIMEVYTTAVGSLYGFVARLTEGEGSKRKIYAVITSVIAFFAAQFGFSNMVKTIFPAVGYAGLLLLGGLVITNLRGVLFKLYPGYAFAKPLKNKLEKKDKE